MQLEPRLWQGISLFKGIAPDELSALLNCMGARRESFRRGEFIFLNGEATHAIGVVLAGQVQVLKEDAFGNRAVLNVLGPQTVFGEAFVCGGAFTLTVSVQALADCDILFLPFQRMLQTCPKACGFHSAIIYNMVNLLADKSLQLVQKLAVTTKHSLREKLLTYLSQLVQAQGRTTVTSPLGRLDLADFLGVDRSALTRELNRMQDAGLIAFSKNKFTLLNASLPMND